MPSLVTPLFPQPPWPSLAGGGGCSGGGVWRERVCLAAGCSDAWRRLLLSLLAALRIVPAHCLEQHEPEAGRAQESEVALSHAEGSVTPWLTGLPQSLQLASAGFGPDCARNRPSAWWGMSGACWGPAHRHLRARVDPQRRAPDRRSRDHGDLRSPEK